MGPAMTCPWQPQPGPFTRANPDLLANLLSEYDRSPGPAGARRRAAFACWRAGEVDSRRGCPYALLSLYRAGIEMALPPVRV